MNRPNLRTTLAVAAIGLSMAGIGYVGWAFVASLKPTEATLLSHQVEIGLSELKPGQVLRVDWEGTDVFVLRRTPEQIAWLESYAPPALKESARIPEPSPKLENAFRSVRPDFLVVGIWKNGPKWALRENQHMSYLCDDFRYSPTPLRLSQDLVFPGGFYCAHMYGHEATDLSKEAWVYDPAGRSKMNWISPLHIPPHKLEGNTLILGYRN